MSKVFDLKNEIDKQEQAMKENDASGTAFEEVVLTDEEKKKIEEIRTDKIVVVNEQVSEDGSTVNIPLEDYAAILDNKIAKVDDKDVIKVLESGDIKKSDEDIKREAKSAALKTFREFAVKDVSNITDDEYMVINNNAFEALKNHFGVDKLEADKIIPKLMKMTMQDIVAILPPEFVSFYVEDKYISVNNSKGKEKLLAAINYLLVTGPEMDYLNEYIEAENKLIAVANRLIKCQVDFNELLKDEKTITQYLQESYEISPKDTESYWSKYFSDTKMVHNYFANSIICHRHIKESYISLMEEYPDTPENDKARQMIQEEIDECDNKIAIYMSICNLDRFKELVATTTARYAQIAKNNKLSYDYIIEECNRAVTSIYRCKQNLPFPGYDNKTSNTALIFKSFMNTYTSMINDYNAKLLRALSKNDEENTKDKKGITPICLNNDAVTTPGVISVAMAIVMGRLVKKLASNTSDKYDAIELDAYFKLICNLGTDLYVMKDIVDILSPLCEIIYTAYMSTKNINKGNSKLAYANNNFGLDKYALKDLISISIEKH